MDVWIVISILMVGPIIYMIVGVLYHRILLVRLSKEQPKWAYWRWRSYGVGSMISNLLVIGYFYFGWEDTYLVLLFILLLLGGYGSLGFYHVSNHNMKKTNLTEKTFRDKKAQRVAAKKRRQANKQKK